MADSNDRSHLSKVQDLCTGYEAELVLGEIYGLREWSIYSSSDLYTSRNLPEDFCLIGHFGHQWDLTQPLEGTCQSDPAQMSIAVGFSSRELQDPADIERRIRKSVATILDSWNEVAPMLDPAKARLHIDFGTTVQTADWLLDNPYFAFNSLRIPERFMDRNRGNSDASAHLLLSGPLLPHPVGHPSCTCGIYGYHDRRSLTLTTPNGARGFVVGLVKAYGHVTVGTKGFRAAKAQTIAVTLPQQYSPPDRILAPVLAEWKDAGITILPSTAALLDFADRGGYLESPENLQPEDN